MARYNGPKCRLCRREGTKLYLKGTKCEGEKCTLNKRFQAPGQHGNPRRKRVSEYGVQLREKQKAKRIYGILEKQFKNYVDSSLKSKGVSGEVLMQNLESRLDNMVYRSGFAVSRAQARQLIRSGFFMVNGKVVDIPSLKLKVGDIIKPVSFEKIHLREGFILPEWLEANIKERQVKYSRMPALEDLQSDINIQLIIEYYSR
ncbi:MAG: 30S ribosomal protein S4 [candidate division WWE3 bacterium GW2011_GWC1_41_7]|uniref:Small ribosomal subunit protein uS4 n=3 Tax=Katanobacteria TaxID=422282 RepID=A0A0G0X6X3_UNCKA|nr:MAG: 30S ribosomal protein S4 [candidate division WWE3 bacterium GW2011_GWB1_41_6]KKS20834.1 MAG: 30S ribosomal protein S4 [candidate division WWE3 bacterium GW2011_GWC1_41_7]OGC58347.1 MAG: 30S ribosomal protein S4 [candidate division WWE3 bacterium RIFCSPLOWO2_01_FULL_41_9]